MNEDEHNQQQLELQERLETDPEYRAEYEEWLDDLERDRKLEDQPTEKEMKCQTSTQ